jgi:hypothetical protein
MALRRMAKQIRFGDNPRRYARYTPYGKMRDDTRQTADEKQYQKERQGGFAE